MFSGGETSGLQQMFSGGETSGLQQMFSGGETSGLQQVSAAAGLSCYGAVLLEQMQDVV